MELSKMGKTELRAACRSAKVKSYSKLTVAGMREALTQLDTAVLADVFPAPAAKTKPVVKKAVAPKPEREVRNGVRRPIRGVCADTWAALDDLVAKGETDLTTAIHAIGDKRGWNRNNTSCELSAFRKYHGIARSTKTA